MKFNLFINLNSRNIVQLGVHTEPDLTDNEIYQTLQTAFEYLKKRDQSILVNVLFSALETLGDQTDVMNNIKLAIKAIELEKIN